MHAHKHDVFPQAGFMHQRLRNAHAALGVGSHFLPQAYKFRFEIKEVLRRQGNAVQLSGNFLPVFRQIGHKAAVVAGQPEFPRGVVRGESIAILAGQHEPAFGIQAS